MNFLELIKNSKYNKKIKAGKAIKLIKDRCKGKDIIFEFNDKKLEPNLKNSYPKCFERYSEKYKDYQYKKSKN